MKTLALVGMLALMPVAAMAADSVKPIVLSQKDVAGAVFLRSEAKTLNHEGNKTTDYLMLLTEDKKYEAGMYKSGPAHFERKGAQTYGVDEFMYFLKGSVTLTSVDGTVQHIQAGEAVVIPAAWQGTWDTKGYTKFYAIYAPKGDAD